MARYPTHDWAYVVESFRRFSATVPGCEPMGEAVAQIAESRYASGLFPVQSMHTLLLYQHDLAGPEDEQLRLDCEDGESAAAAFASASAGPCGGRKSISTDRRSLSAEARGTGASGIRHWKLEPREPIRCCLPRE
jgi:hypothetical protein